MTTSAVPVQVAGLTGATSGVSVGNGFACALTAQPGSGGTGGPGAFVQCWGHNASGQLGNTSTSDSATPVYVQGLNNATAVSAGDDFACALLSDSTVVCWGDNTFGQLGDDSTASSLVPVPVNGLMFATHISAGGDFACAQTNGKLVCWGHNNNGQLGDNSGADSTIPVNVAGLTGGVYFMSAGSESACAVAGGVGVACWGLNTDGQLGNDSTNSSAVPVGVTGMASYPSALSAGGASACAVSAAGGVACWGLNAYGQLGNNSTTTSLVPVSVVGFP